MKATFNGRRPPMEDDIKILKVEYLSNHSSDLPQFFEFKLRGPNQNGILLEIKTTSNGRRPQNIKSGISQQPLIGSYSNFQLKLLRPTHIL